MTNVGQVQLENTNSKTQRTLISPLRFHYANVESYVMHEREDINYAGKRALTEEMS